MNRRAMVIIMASSWAGTPIFLKGRSRDSMPSVSTMGDVVKVIREDTRSSRTSRRDIFTPSTIPSLVTVMNFQCHRASPGSVTK